MKLWHIGSRGNVVRESDLMGHSGKIDQLAWHPTDPNVFATASSDKTMRLWDARQSKSVQTVKTQGENINIAWAPDGSCVGVGNKDDLISFIDTKTWRSNHLRFQVEINEFSWDPSGRFVFLCTGLGSVDVLNYPSLQKEHSFKAHTGSVCTLQFDPTGRYLGTGGADAFSCLFDLRDLVCVRTFGNLETHLRSISFSHDGEFLASTAEDERIDISDVQTGEHLHYVECRAVMNSIAWSPTARLLAYAGDKKDTHKNVRVISVFGFRNSSSSS